jgi:hypothetical protein
MFPSFANRLDLDEVQLGQGQQDASAEDVVGSLVHQVLENTERSASAIRAAFVGGQAAVEAATPTVFGVDNEGRSVSILSARFPDIGSYYTRALGLTPLLCAPTPHSAPEVASARRIPKSLSPNVGTNSVALAEAENAADPSGQPHLTFPSHRSPQPEHVPLPITSGFIQFPITASTPRAV